MEYLQIIIVVLLVIVLMFLVWLITKVNNLHKQVQEYTDDVDAKNIKLINDIKSYFAVHIEHLLKYQIGVANRYKEHLGQLSNVISRVYNGVIKGGKIDSKAKNSYNYTKQGSKPKRQIKSKKQPKTAKNKDI